MTIEQKQLEIFYSLYQLKKAKHVDIVVAVSKDNEIKNYYSQKIDDANHILDTPIANLILHACQNVGNSNLTIISTSKATEFEKEVIKITGIKKVIYLQFNELILLTNKGRKLTEDKISLPEEITNPIYQQISDEIEKPETSKKGQLATQDSFIWVDDLELKELSPAEMNLQDELYMGLLYSVLFILWNSTARPSNMIGGLDVAAMLVDNKSKPVALSINVNKTDNSIAHAELGMLLRYLNGDTKQLPDNGKLYTTLESCEMCRTGLHLARGNNSFHEIYGQNDSKVKFNIETYLLSAHAPTNDYLRTTGTTIKDDTDFFKFCKANYLALKFFLNHQTLKENYPSLIDNVNSLFNGILNLRVKPWAGNPVLYDLTDDPNDPGFSIVREKQNFEKLFNYYYGEDISQFRVQNKQFSFIGTSTISGIRSLDNFFELGAGSTITITNSQFESNRSVTLRISKEVIKNQKGILSGYHIIDDKKLIGNYGETKNDIHLRNNLFPKISYFLIEQAEQHEAAPAPVPNIRFFYKGQEQDDHIYYLAGEFNEWLGKTDGKIKPKEGDDQWKMQYNNATATWNCKVYIAPGNEGERYEFNIYDAKTKQPIRKKRYKLDKNFPTPPDNSLYYYKIN